MKCKIVLIRIIFLLLIYVTAYSQQQENIYIAQDIHGDGTGTDAENAHALSWLNNSDNWTTVQESDGLIGPGDIVHLCGTFNINPLETAITVNGSGTPENPITILFEDNARLTSPCFGGTFTMDGGAIYINEKENIVIDGGTNGIVESTDTGSKGYFTYYRTSQDDNNIPGNIAINILRGNDIQIKNLNILNMYQSQETFEDNGYEGRYGDVGSRTHSAGVFVYGSNNISFHDNIITYIGVGISVNMADNTGIDIYNNEFSRVGVSTFSGGYTSIAADNIKVHHNRIYDTSDWAYNDGIKFFAVPTTTDEYRGIRIYNNIIGPNISVGAEHPATAWILADQGFIIEPEIYNNLLIAGENDGSPDRALHFIEVGGNGHAIEETLNQNGKIYNNTMVSKSNYNTVGIIICKWSVGNVIYNNIMYAENRLIDLLLTDEYSSVSDCDYNLIFSKQGTVSGECNGENNINANPLLNSEYMLTDSSPAIDSGKMLGEGYADYDLAGVSRPYGTGWDIGAYEYTDSSGISNPDSYAMKLYQNYPNPFKSETIFEYELPGASMIDISLYDITGRKVRTFYSGMQSEGPHAVRVNGGDLSSGIYFLKLKDERFTDIRKCLLVK